MKVVGVARSAQWVINAMELQHWHALLEVRGNGAFVWSVEMEHSPMNQVWTDRNREYSLFTAPWLADNQITWNKYWVLIGCLTIGLGECLLCEAGYSCTSVSTTPCSPGYFSYEGAGICLPCSPGTFTPHNGNILCWFCICRNFYCSCFYRL